MPVRPAYWPAHEFRDFVELIQILAKNLYGIVRVHARHGLRHVIDDGLRIVIINSLKLFQPAVHFLNQLVQADLAFPIPFWA